MLEKIKTIRSFWLYFILIGLVFFVLFFALNFHQIEYSDFVKTISSLIGTFVGAFLAFRLQEYREERKEEQRRKAALNRALLVLGIHRNEIVGYLKKIEKYNDNIAIAFNFPAIQPQKKYDLSQDIDELFFLVELKEPNLLLDLIIEQGRFDQAIESIRVRNEFYVESLQPALAEKKLNKKEFSPKELEDILGEYLFGGCVTGASSMVSHIKETDKSLLDAFERLLKFSRKTYPSEKFIEFQEASLESESKA